MAKMLSLLKIILTGSARRTDLEDEARERSRVIPPPPSVFGHTPLIVRGPKLRGGSVRPETSTRPPEQPPHRSQVGGDHYAKMAIDPFTFTLANGWDAAAHSILKYVHRHEAKGGAEDLRKALDVILIRVGAMAKHRQPPPPVEHRNTRYQYEPVPWAYASDRVTMPVYLAKNHVPPAEAQALMVLDRWVENPSDRELPTILAGLIEQVLKARYGAPARPASEKDLEALKRAEGQRDKVYHGPIPPDPKSKIPPGFDPFPDLG